MNTEPPVQPPVVPAPPRRVPSLVLAHTGNGKGKSSAAFGTMLRAVARGWPVAVVQFLKSGKWHTGEETIGLKLGVEWWSLGDGFSWDSVNMDETEAIARAAWQFGKEKLAAGDHRLVIFDEISYPINWGWIDVADVVDAITTRPENVNVIVTGRDLPPPLIAIADTVTEMVNVKHAYESGILAKKGIDF